MTSTGCSSTGPKAGSRIRACANCSCAWPSGRASSIAGRCCRRRPAGCRTTGRAASTMARMPADLEADGNLCRGSAGAGAAGDRQARGAGRPQRSHPSRRCELHRLRRAGDRPDHRPPARPRQCRADPGRLHGLLRGGVGAAHRLSYRPLGAGGEGAGGDGRALHACICRSARSSSRCSPCSSSATAPPRLCSAPSRPA